MRCNAGVPPSVLTDQHLIAEYRELLIPLGQLKSLGFKSKASAPSKLKLGTGHVTFWRDKQLYLARRHNGLVQEMLIRGFKPNLTFWDLKDVPGELKNDWVPSIEDTILLRDRIAEKICMKPSWYRIKGKSLVDVGRYMELLYYSKIEL